MTLPTAQGVHDLLVSKMPRAVISLEEISDGLGIEPDDLIPLVMETKSAGLIEDWWRRGERWLFCCLSTLEAGRRLLWLTSPWRKSYRTARRNGKEYDVWFTADQLAE